jgi:hypothetical protein
LQTNVKIIDRFPMQFIRQNLLPAFIVVIFLVALAATSARIFLPADLSLPAPM